MGERNETGWIHDRKARGVGLVGVTFSLLLDKEIKSSLLVGVSKDKPFS